MYVINNGFKKVHLDIDCGHFFENNNDFSFQLGTLHTVRHSYHSLVVIHRLVRG